LEDSHIFLHPIRYRPVELIAEQPRHVNALSSALGLERRLATYYLATLEERGFAMSGYEISEGPKMKGKALRMYTAIDKVADVKVKLKKGL
jgi:hypothetical protein